MIYFLTKIMLSAVIIASVSELAKRFSWFAAIIASLPLVSILSMIWLYNDTKSVEKIMSFSYGVFWAVLPSLLFFLVLPVLLKMGFSFPKALVVSMVVLAISYSIYVAVLSKIGVTF